MTWLYIQSERATVDHPYALYTVGHYAPDGTWHPESDHNDADEAARRVAWLNGSPRLGSLLDLCRKWREVAAAAGSRELRTTLELAEVELQHELAQLLGGGR